MSKDLLPLDDEEAVAEFTGTIFLFDQPLQYQIGITAFTRAFPETARLVFQLTDLVESGRSFSLLLEEWARVTGCPDATLQACRGSDMNGAPIPSFEGGALHLSGKYRSPFTPLIDEFVARCVAQRSRFGTPVLRPSPSCGVDQVP